jgi:hypothetical protein
MSYRHSSLGIDWDFRDDEMEERVYEASIVCCYDGHSHEQTAEDVYPTLEEAVRAGSEALLKALRVDFELDEQEK